MTNSTQFTALLAAFFASWQVKTLTGLILLDVLFGVACALRQSRFEWLKLATFYRTMVVPYIIGYLALYVAVGFLVPPDALGGAGDFVNEAAITAAWGALVFTLLSGIKAKFAAIYQFRPPGYDYGPHTTPDYSPHVEAEHYVPINEHYTQGSEPVEK